VINGDELFFPQCALAKTGDFGLLLVEGDFLVFPNLFDQIEVVLEGQEQLLFGRIGEVQRASAPQKRPSEMKNVGLATTAGQERQRRGVPSLDQDVDRLNERLKLNLALFL